MLRYATRWRTSAKRSYRYYAFTAPFFIAADAMPPTPCRHATPIFAISETDGRRTETGATKRNACVRIMAQDTTFRQRRLKRAPAAMLPDALPCHADAAG